MYSSHFVKLHGESRHSPKDHRNRVIRMTGVQNAQHHLWLSQYFFDQFFLIIRHSIRPFVNATIHQVCYFGTRIKFSVNNSSCKYKLYSSWFFVKYGSGQPCDVHFQSSLFKNLSFQGRFRLFEFRRPNRIRG